MYAPGATCLALCMSPLAEKSATYMDDYRARIAYSDAQSVSLWVLLSCRVFSKTLCILEDMNLHFNFTLVVAIWFFQTSESLHLHVVEVAYNITNFLFHPKQRLSTKTRLTGCFCLRGPFRPLCSASPGYIEICAVAQQMYAFTTWVVNRFVGNCSSFWKVGSRHLRYYEWIKPEVQCRNLAMLEQAKQVLRRDFVVLGQTYTFSSEFLSIFVLT